VTEPRKPNIDANATDEAPFDDGSPPAAHTQWDTSRPRSRPPSPSHTQSPSRRPPMIIDVPRIHVEADESDAATTIFDPLEEAGVEELKRKLRGEPRADEDANQTLELRRLRGVKLEELEGLLRASDDANATIQHAPVDDKTLEELDASLTVEKRNRGLRKISAPVFDAEPAGEGWRGNTRASSTFRDVDAEMFAALGHDIAAAWRAVAGLLRRAIRSIASGLARLRGRAPSEPRRLAHPDDTVPPLSRRARRLLRFRRR
jgi:hypothetical protein